MPDALCPLLERPVLGALVLLILATALGATIGAALGARVYRAIVGAAKRKGEAIEARKRQVLAATVARWREACAIAVELSGALSDLRRRTLR